METKNIVKNFAEQAKLVSCIGKKEFIDALSPIIGTKAELIYALGQGILIDELETTIKEFPVLHKKQVLRLFEKTAYVTKKDWISGGRIFRETLLDIVYALEDYTGRRIAKDADAPLAYLEYACKKDEKILIEDIADYFSERRDRKISKLIARDSQPEVEQVPVSEFIASNCGVDELDQNAPISSLGPVIGGEKIGDCYVVLYWLQVQYNKEIPPKFVKSKTVGELIEYLS